MIRPLPKRGRPLKFDRPARTIAVTLPLDALAALKRVHLDPGWAIVRLLQQASGRRRRTASPPASLVRVRGRQQLIAVEPRDLADVQGLSTIPLADGRALISLPPESNVASLELALSDRWAALDADSDEAVRIARIRDQVRAWRRDKALSFRVRAILIAERSRGANDGRARAAREGRTKNRPARRRS
jgi:hypothetical protein